MEFKGLSEETKAKLKGCETPEEILELAREDGYELSGQITSQLKLGA